MVFLISGGMWEASWGLAQVLLTVWSKVGIVLMARCYTQGSGNGLSNRNLWLWLINHGVPRNETDRQQLRCVLIYLTKAILGLVNRGLTGAKVLEHFGFTDPASPSEREASTCEERSCCDTTQAYCQPSALSFLVGLVVVNLNTCTLRKGKHLNLGNIGYWLKVITDSWGLVIPL